MLNSFRDGNHVKRDQLFEKVYGYRSQVGKEEDMNKINDLDDAVKKLKSNGCIEESLLRGMPIYKIKNDANLQQFCTPWYLKIPNWVGPIVGSLILVCWYAIGGFK